MKLVLCVTPYAEHLKYVVILSWKLRLTDG